MTRIVSGAAGGRTLRVPGKGTRPTSERVREALFSRLEHLGAVAGARVLDLYAGSGALGLEAASRGAATVTFVESSRAAADVCRANASATRLPRLHVVTERAERFVDRAAASAWDLVLIDPPYELSEVDLSRVLGALVGTGDEPHGLGSHLAEDAVVVVERSSRSPEPDWPAAMSRTEERRYGETVIWFASPGPGVGTPDPGSPGIP
ncbi:MAG TPA: 16S rRNA (guanine(966)-N(2))-methyltransferase RsmD [Cellulomonadaceae bacterium]|nr:16S rRNA (guanine(966)-N(2))-methyltransferase RsmD [Cellulomonadaceae bacterium]